ncbi:MAG: hypothetical protein ABIO94_11915 [Opitutaceae bacterium]
MNAKPTTPKTAAPSTPAAAPAGSLPEENPKLVATPGQGADAEKNTDEIFDIASALGQLSEAPAADGESDDETPPGAEETPATGAADTPPAESEAETEAGDAPADATGDVDNSPEAPEAAAEAAPEGDEETPSNENAPVTPGTPAEKRIHELLARSKTAETELAQARESLAALEAVSNGTLEPGVFEHIDTIADLSKKRSNIVRLHQWALAHRDGGELPAPDGKSANLVYDADGVAGLLSNTFQLIHEALPAREQYLREREQADAQAVTAYPWLKDTRNEQTMQVQKVIEKMPAIRRLGPNYRIVAADALIGQTFRAAGIPVDQKLIARLQAELKTRPTSPGAKRPAAPAEAAPVRRIPPAAPRGAGVVPARVNAATVQAQAATKRLNKGDGNVNDLTASIAAGLKY